MKWDSDGDQHLLLAILATHSIKLDSVRVSKMMGGERTPRAVEERFKKLRKMAKERGLEAAYASGGSPKKVSMPANESPPGDCSPTPKMPKIGSGKTRDDSAKLGLDIKGEVDLFLRDDVMCEKPNLKRSRDDFEAGAETCGADEEKTASALLEHTPSIASED
ncbi:MAG: hypothetical protein M1832_001264 [Thelocarpon impressellum]|nr:MAG: hypothetical protein M1832_001264 [Thelocarpon impressellum]